jgi:serine/threonine-protein kinase
MITREDTSRRMYRALIVTTFTLMASLSVWLGPFVLVPVASCCLAMIYAAQLGPEDRRFMSAAALLITAVPFGLEFLHVLPPAWAFRDGSIVLFARALEIEPRWTLPGLVYSSLSFVVAATYYIGQLRDSLARAERTLFTQAWHFRQLIGTDAQPTKPPPVTDPRR